MKQLLLTLLSSALFLTHAAVAQTTSFDTQTGQLSVGCVALYQGDVALQQNGQPQTFSVQMQLQADSFALQTLNPVSGIEQCSGRFDANSGLFTDRVRLADDAFLVSMQLNNEGRFALVGASHEGAADTSLWRVSKEGRHLFIAGAMHALHSKHFPLPAVYEHAYQQAQVVVMEIVLNTQQEYNDYYNVTNLVTRTDGSKLSQQLTLPTRLSLASYLSYSGLTINAVDQYTASYVANALSNMEMQRLGYNQPGVDSFYGNTAVSQGKPLLGLETVKSQQQVLFTSYGATDEQLISAALQDVTSGRMGTTMEQLARAWREGNVDTVNSYVVLPMKESTPAYYDSLNTQRNIKWVPQIEQMLQNDEVEMILVGLLHLVGEDSVLKMLQDRGYTVELY